MKTPDLDGKYGQAWKFDLAGAVKRYGEKGGQLESWWIRAPWANLMWHSYAVLLVHLRPIAKNPEPRIYLPGATHEIMVAALHPDGKMQFDARPPMLSPLNFAAQFIETSDEAAEARCRKCVEEIVLLGHLSPDTDWVQLWIARFNDSMMRTGATPAGTTQITLDGGGHSQKIEIAAQDVNRRPIDKLCACGLPATPITNLCNDCYKKLPVSEQRRMAMDFMKKFLR